MYGQLPFVPERASGCDIITSDRRRILDLYGGHAVAALGYGHPRLVNAVSEQCKKLMFQSNAVALEIRARAAEKLISVAPEKLQRVFFVNSGAEANENALRMACVATGRGKVLAITQGFHGRTAAAAAVTWNSEKLVRLSAETLRRRFHTARRLRRGHCDDRRRHRRGHRRAGAGARRRL